MAKYPIIIVFMCCCLSGKAGDSLKTKLPLFFVDFTTGLEWFKGTHIAYLSNYPGTASYTDIFTCRISPGINFFQRKSGQNSGM